MPEREHVVGFCGKACFVCIRFTMRLVWAALGNMGAILRSTASSTVLPDISPQKDLLELV
ncbi:MAG: hypothetical protein QMC77_03935 [Methanocellales archaeon]|nr:hypothetical protein [Methanocellales archaeon]